MIDNNEEVFNALNSLGVTVDFNYPSKKASFPSISFWDSGHTSDDYKDGKSGIDKVETTVDVWEKADQTTGIRTKIHAEVDSKMRSEGFLRIQGVSLYESDTKIFHYQYKYVKPYEEVD